MNVIPNFIKRRNVDWKSSLIYSFIKDKDKVLDFGCGDLSFAKSLKAIFPFLQITGVDVVDLPKRPKDIKFIAYDGRMLPFKNNSFDTVISFYVFHHCNDAMASFKECARVAKRRIIFVESVYRYPLEVPFMKFMDWIYNKVKSESIQLSYQFFPYDYWIKVFEKHGLKITRCKKIKQIFLPSFLPIGISYVFEVTKKS